MNIETTGGDGLVDNFMAGSISLPIAQSDCYQGLKYISIYASVLHKELEYKFLLANCLAQKSY